MTHQALLLIDTNIISHALTDNQTSAYRDLFAELEQSYKFVVTGFTKFEITRSSKKIYRDKIEEFIDQNMAYAELSRQLMDFAARLNFLYSNHKSTKGKNITMGDIVNAAFAIAKPSDVLTIDNNDYPTPFFAEVSRHRISYTSKQGNAMTDVACILRPDVDNVEECFMRHVDC